MRIIAEKITKGEKMGKGYSSDDNRSMQLNTNNDRYYSSRGIDRDDLDWDYDEDDNNETGENMLFEIGNIIINSRNISAIRVENCAISFRIEKVDNDDYDRYYDSGYESKKKVKMLSVLVDVDALIFMNDNGDGIKFTMYGNRTEGATENRYKSPDYRKDISHSKYFPDISFDMSLIPRVICIDKRKDCDDVEGIKNKIYSDIHNTVNQFVIAYVNKVMENQRP
jgi:hypothetical protein